MTASTDAAAPVGAGAGAACAPASRVPDFFILGHAKCGTTALYEMLRRHPQIYMPELKEPAFFATDLRSRFQRPSSGPLPQTLEEYLSLFSSAGAAQIVGEASSSYIVSSTAARAIAELQPAARTIAILREPASFLRSLHLQLLQNHIETEKNLRKALALEDERRQGRRIPRRSPRPQALLYSERVRYVEQLRRYRALFGAERVLVLVYDDFRSDNEATVRRVLRFLGVDDTVPIAATQANPTVRMRSQRLDDLLHAVSVGRGPLSRAAKASAKVLAPAQLRRAALRGARRRFVVGAPEPPDEALMIELRRRFKGEVVALSDYLDRDLVTLWGYDRIG
jgi:Sulfotransferase family